ncbi:hypothetical protein [Nocardia sp. NPDC057227]|uniref:VG15 protein n=1 Tax=Nocardia sp. NPDC057227 TaxID=3346056 RepID=UPI00362A537A
MTAPAQQEQPQQTSQELAWLAAWLTMNHQEEQSSIAAKVALALIPLWRLLRPRDLRSTQVPWIEAVLPVVESAYERSQWAAQQFAIDLRHARLPRAEELVGVTGAEPARERLRPADIPERLRRGADWPQAEVLESSEFPARRSVASLLGTGPGEVVRRLPAVEAGDSAEADASTAARALSTRVAARIALDGGRRVVQRAVDLDQEAIGWARVLNASPCYFCALLASRGAVYKADSFASADGRFDGDGIAKTHDKCRCGMRPVYSPNDFFDHTAADALRQWKEVKKLRLPNAEGVREYRRRYTTPPPPPFPRVDAHSLIVQRNRLLNDGFAPDSDQVVWFDQQIGRFGVLIDGGAVTPRKGGAVAEMYTPTASGMQRALRELSTAYASQLRRGVDQGSKGMQWYRRRIAELEDQLAS